MNVKRNMKIIFFFNLQIMKPIRSLCYRLAGVSKEVTERVRMLMDHNDQRRRDQDWTNLELLAKQVKHEAKAS
jgi:hypothetical protein